MGRPRKPIDWEKVKDLLIAGCSGTEIAPHFEMHHDTFYDRCMKEHGMTFTQYASQYHEMGAGLIRAHQYAKAMGESKKGDTTLLMWLGKQRCGQSDNKEEVKGENIQSIAKFFSDIREVSGVQESTESEMETEKSLLDKR